jgi:ferredoxin
MPAVRKIVKIDEEKCDGCGLCIPACAEGALQIIDGKARLVDDRFCDGLGDCLGECPRGAIEIIEREAAPFDEGAVKDYLKKQQECSACAGMAERDLRGTADRQHETAVADADEEAELTHWPVQLHLVSPQARFLQGRELLISADCVPFAFASFHPRLLRDKSLLVGCPKLDDVESYHRKLVEIFKYNDIPKITLAYMEVSCCFGLSRLVKSALAEAGCSIPVEEVIVGVDGSIKERKGN